MRFNGRRPVIGVVLVCGFGFLLCFDMHSVCLKVYIAFRVCEYLSSNRSINEHIVHLYNKNTRKNKA